MVEATTALASPTPYFKCLFHQSESTCAKFFPAKFQSKDASVTHDTSLSCSTWNATLTSARIRTPNIPSGGTAMFQGTVERVTKEPTVWLHPRRTSQRQLHQSECSWYGLEHPFSFPSAHFSLSRCLSPFFFCFCRGTLSSRWLGRCSAV